MFNFISLCRQETDTAGATKVQPNNYTIIFLKKSSLYYRLEDKSLFDRRVRKCCRTNNCHAIVGPTKM